MLANITAGKSVKSITSSINDLADDQQYRTTRYVRTFMTSTTSEADDKSMEDAGFEHYRFVATLDEVTCPVCGSVDNQVFPIKESEAGENSPPMHYNCRCRKVVVFTDEKLKRSTRIARDENGNPIKVPADMDYAEYKREYLDDPPEKVPEIEPKPPAPEPPAPKVEIAPTQYTTATELSPEMKGDFTTVQTPEELVQMMKTRLGFENIDLAQFAEMDFEAMRSTAAQIEQMIVEFRSLHGAMPEFMAIEVKELGSAYAGVYRSTNNMIVHPMWYGKGNVEKLKTSLAKNARYEYNSLHGIETRYFASGTIEGNAAHEAGHAVFGVHLRNLYPNEAVRLMMYDKEAQNIVSQAVREVKRMPEYKGRLQIGIRLEISEYSLKSPSETIAEAFSDYFKNGSNAKPLSLKIIRIMKRLVP